MNGRYPYCTEALPAFFTWPMTSKIRSSSGQAPERRSCAAATSGNRNKGSAIQSKRFMAETSVTKIALDPHLNLHELVENLWFRRLGTCRDIASAPACSIL